MFDINSFVRGLRASAQELYKREVELREQASNCLSEAGEAYLLICREQELRLKAKELTKESDKCREIATTLSTVCAGAK